MRPARLVTILSAAVFLAVLMPAASPATEGIARNTGFPCSACHVDPQGGGTLTVLGEYYYRALKAGAGPGQPIPSIEKAARLVLGYIHILAGVVWFGAIFYVHILLKPAYAAKGLPRGELLLGWVCIIAVGTTGAALTLMRIPSLDALLSSRFGMLLMAKILLYLIMAGSAAVVTFVLGPRMKRRIAAAKESGEGEYTPEELKSFDGKEGRKPLIAFEGLVYDVSGSRLWKDGKHARHLAGGDLTEAIKQAPHGKEKLEGFSKAGRVVPERVKPRPDRPKAVFYFMAYMNLVLIFMVLGIIALWRWW